MAALRQSLIRILILSQALFLSSCSEVKVLISVLFTETTSLSTSSFEFDEIRSGNRLTCAILGDKSVRCIGTGEAGSLGTFNGGPVLAGTTVKLIATGRDFTCYVSGENSALFCFGRNDKGQLGNPSAGNSIKPVAVMDLESNGLPITEVRSLSAGAEHACAVLKSGRAVCWGDNSVGQLGNISQTGIGARSVLESERNQKPFANVKDISAGGASTCFIARDDSSVFCLGERYGNTRKVNWIPERVDLANSIGSLNNVRQVSVGKGFACALTKGAQVYCWGQNDQNQLGILINVKGMPKASLVQVSYPQEMALSRIEQITTGDSHACAIHRDEKTVYCWGDNRLNQLGSSSSRGNTEQVALGSNNLTLKGVKEVRAGPDRTCIISTRDELFCWGNGESGLLGNPKPLSVYPSRVLDSNLEALAGIAHVQIGGHHSCTLDLSGRMYCFGLNTYGQMGFTRVSGQALQTEASPLKKVSAIDIKGNRVCVIYGEDQRAGCFGGKEFDNLASRPEHNNFILEELKRNNVLIREINALAIGNDQICIVTGSQEVTCIPTGEKSRVESAVKVQDQATHKPLKDIWQVKAQDQFACALSQAEGSAWCWGQSSLEQAKDAHGLLSEGRPLKELIQLAITHEQVCAIKGAERTVYCGNAIDFLKNQFEMAPLKTEDGGILRGVLSLSGGSHHSCAVTDNGKLYCWGSNEYYQFGMKSPKSSLVGVLVPVKNERIRKITRVTTGDTHTCITSTEDPTLYCFGGSFYNGSNSIDPIEYPL
jgi:alpha-tubulin suppressor-like RCC1 family protein